MRILDWINGTQSQVPQALVDLLQITKKAELLAYTKTLEITSSDISNLIHNCGTIGYTHLPQWNNITPPHLNNTLGDIRNLAIADTPDAFSKIRKKTRALFTEGNQLSSHFFINDEGKWHLFYFTFHDTENGKPNHWECGSHIHFVNYLWPQMTIPLLKEIFGSERPNISVSTHIKFLDV